MSSPRRIFTRRRFFAGAAVVYAGIVFWLVPPLSRGVRVSLPVGRNGTVTVPLFNLWTIWWNSDRCRHGFQRYWDAPIFFPTENTFAFSEPQPATVAVAPVVWLTGSRVLAYKCWLWASLFLNGFVTALILRARKRRPATAFLAGLGMLLLPIVHNEIDVLQLIPLWGVLWCWHALDRMCREPSLRRGVTAGIAAGITFAMCVHHGLFMTLLLPTTAWVFLRDWRSDKLFLSACAAATAGAAMIVPLVRPIHLAARAHNFERSDELVHRLSAGAADYLSLPATTVVKPRVTDRPARFSLCPGWIKLAFAAVAILSWVLRRRTSRYGMFLFLTGLCAFLFSFGPHVKIGAWTPWESLSAHVAGFNQVRSVYRFAFFAQIAVVLLAAEGLNLMIVVARRCAARRELVRVFVVAVGVLAAIENWPHQPATRGVPDEAANAAWIDYVREQTPRGRGVICLPFVQGRLVGDFASTTRWMYYGTFHGAPLVNGYSGFFPQSHFELEEILAEGILSERALATLAARQVELLIVRRSYLSREAADLFRSTEFRLTRVLEGHVDVYRLIDLRASEEGS